ncbi:GNAT family N-acetyltransferase [Paenibacillus sp. CC-CFT747]|nr:GNAT family N-acetyltransferase [Paenibacillus sp. CC-CFT747]
MFLRPLVMKDAPALLELMVRNRELFEQVVPVRHELFYTLGKQEEIIRNSEKARMEGSRYAFGIFLLETEELIGEISLFEIMRGALQRAFLGYCLDERHNGKGLMTEAVSQVLDFAFREAGLHRIEAGAKPSNPGSLRVLEKAGFQKEGLARQNVKINGKWEDHVMYAILASDPRG